MSREKKLAKKKPQRMLGSQWDDAARNDPEFVQESIGIDDNIYMNESRPFRAGGAAGRAMKSPRALMAQAESKWAQTNGRYNDRYGVITPFTDPSFGRIANRIVDPLTVKKINSANWDQKGPTGKLAQPQKTKGKSGPSKNR
jgi:hypothetical protein